MEYTGGAVDVLIWNEQERSQTEREHQHRSKQPTPPPLFPIARDEHVNFGRELSSIKMPELKRNDAINVLKGTATHSSNMDFELCNLPIRVGRQTPDL